MLFLHGIGHAHPENEISNDFLTDLDIGTNAEWILERTGIRSRRTTLDLDYIRQTRNQDVRAASEASVCTNAQLGAQAATMAMRRAGVTADEIGLVIAGGSVPSSATPAEACIIAAELGIQTAAIDLRSACTSFAATLHFLSMLRPEAIAAFGSSAASASPGTAPYVLVVEAESVTRVVDYNDRSSAVLWGDGAAAAVLSTEVPASVTVEHTALCSDPRGHNKVVVPWAGHFSQEGATVQSFAIRKSVRELRALQKRFNEDDRSDDRLHFIGHQANLLMLENVCRSCEIDDSRHHKNVEDFGNTATAGAPSVLSASWDQFTKGDQIAIVGVGAGLTWASMMLRFAA